MINPRFSLIAVLFSVLAAVSLPAQNRPNAEFQALQSHFSKVAVARYDTMFAGIKTVGQWEGRKKQYRQELLKMLFHERQWSSAPPPVRITNTVEHRDFTMQCLVVETDPQLYATCNLYLPIKGKKPYPVILYQCGHANKRRYKQHGAWFASNGIAVLMMDNIEMGEMEFTHHGLYSHAWWHWYSRGFSPLAVELLNAKRVVDYLVSRPDLSSDRIGATGISGGGMTTFFLAAIDERIAAAAPVSGELSTKGWIEQQLSRAHCDCQFPVNSYGLYYSQIGAIAAPMPQLMCNSDADRGFPMDAFGELYDKMGEIYSLYGADAALDTAIAPGGHSDSEPIRLPVYEFFLKQFLGIDTTITTEGVIDTLTSDKLTCWLEGFPLREKLTRIDEELIPAWELSFPPGKTEQDANERKADLVECLLRESFRYFPEQALPLKSIVEDETQLLGRRVSGVSFASFDGLRVRGKMSLPKETESGGKIPAVLLLDHRRGIPVWGNEQLLEANQWGECAVLVASTLDRGNRVLEGNLRSYNDDDPLHHMKRQAMVAGTTLDAMAVFEVLRCIEFLRSRPEIDPERITVLGKGEVGINGLYAALLDGKVERVVLGSPTASHRDAPIYLNVLRYTDIPEVIGLLGEKVRMYGEIPPVVRMAAERSGAKIEKFLDDCLP
jgi:cephalosporin-C deacetylase-like acetyl esterase